MTEESKEAERPVAGSDVDSATFSRCAECRFAEHVDRSAGTLLCLKHNMRVNAEADEIPDDCTACEPSQPQTHD